MRYANLFAEQEFEAEKWLLYYPILRAECEMKRQEIIDGSSKPPDEGKTTHISQVTCNKAVRLSGTWDENKWICDVEFVIGQFPPCYRTLLEIRWRQILAAPDPKRGRPAWIEDAILHYAELTGEWPHNNTLSAWWRDMVVTLARWVNSKEAREGDR